MILLAIILAAYGILLIGWPHITWKIDHFWDVKGGEPTQLYLTLARVGGVILIIAAIAIPLLEMRS